MPELDKRLTKAAAAALPLPASGYELYWCPKTAGFGVRISASGDRAYVAQRRVGGKSIRRTLGKAVGIDAISNEYARELHVKTSAGLQHGNDPLEAKREQRKAEKIEGVTLEVALRGYVKNKVRAKDKLPLKEQTRADYLAMIAAPGTTKQGKPTLGGSLYPLARKPLHRITADDIRKLHTALASRGERRQTYAMQVLRAVLRHEGIAIDGNPLSPTTAGAQRVQLAPSRGNPSPIPPDRLGAWWRAAGEVASPSADMLKFMLLTGARPGEAAGLLVGDVDLKREQLTLRDTKNRTDHVVLLSKQASVIVHWHADGQKAKDSLFGVTATNKTLATISAAAKVKGMTPHKMRHTFASIAAELVPAFTLRRLLNHSAGGDVAAAHYVGVSDAQLRAAWQAVADHIEAAK